MTREAFVIHLLFAFCLFILSCGICMLIIKRMRIMDIPNDRSSHDRPIPKSGGIVLVITFVFGVITIYFLGDATPIKANYFLGFFVSSLLIALISLYDDMRDRPFLFKLVGQVMAIMVVLYFGIVLNEISLPGIGRVRIGAIGWLLTFVWMLGLTNAYNFMDGLNGMAAGTAVIAASFFSVISFQQGSTFVYIISYALISGALGFLVFNFPIPKLFMGDVGSAFLGFVFANLAIIAALYDHSHTSFLVVPLLLFHFIFDTSFTFIRRFLGGENVFAAHRTHLYQLFNRLGASHAAVSCFHFLVCIFQGMGALYMVTVEGNQRILVFIPYVLFQILYAVIITGRAKKAGLIGNTASDSIRSV